MTDQTSPVLTTTAGLSCSFQGTVTTANAGTIKLVVAGKPVLGASGVTTWTVASCQAVVGNSKSPCATVGAPTAGVSTKLTSNGQAVLLASFSAPAEGSAVTAGHTVAVTPPPPPPPPPAPSRLKAV